MGGLQSFFVLFVVLVFFFSTEGECSKFLSVSGKNFMMNGKKVYLSGVNQPWVNYGDDFGNGAGTGTFCEVGYYYYYCYYYS